MRMLRTGKVPAWVDGAKGIVPISREQHCDLLRRTITKTSTLCKPYLFGRRYIIVIKLSVKKIERESPMIIKIVDYIFKSFPFYRF